MRQTPKGEPVAGAHSRPGSHPPWRQIEPTRPASTRGSHSAPGREHSLRCGSQQASSALHWKEPHTAPSGSARQAVAPSGPRTQVRPSLHLRPMAIPQGAPTGSSFADAACVGTAAADGRAEAVVDALPSPHAATATLSRKPSRHSG